MTFQRAQGKSSKVKGMVIWLIKKGGLCAVDCSGVLRVGCGERDVEQVAQHNRQHYTPPTKPGLTTECLQSEAPTALLQ